MKSNAPMEEENREIYMAEYRVLLKAVLVETLSENRSQVRSVFKEAVKEWLSEQMRSGEAWAVRVLALLFVGTVIWVILHPPR